MDNQLSTTALVIIAASGGVGALLAGLVGAFANYFLNRRDSRNAHKAWLREKKLEAYTDLMTTYMQLAAASAPIREATGNVVSGSDDSIKMLQDVAMLTSRCQLLTDKFKEFNRANIAISTAIRKPIQEFDEDAEMQALATLQTFFINDMAATK